MFCEFALDRVTQKWARRVRVETKIDTDEWDFSNQNATPLRNAEHLS